MTADRLLSVGQVAQRLGYSVTHVRRLLRAGELAGVRYHARGHWRVREAVLVIFVSEKSGQMHQSGQTHRVT